jgi:hypothetical protein
MGKLLLSQQYPPALKVGSSNVSKVYAGSTQVWPATGYYDCGYGCQYYASAPVCDSCNPTATNVLHGLWINASNNLTLNFNITLSNNYSSSSINYVLRMSNTTRGTGPISTGTMTVPGYTIDTFFSGTTASFGVVNVATDSFTVSLSADNGSTWTAQISPTSGTLNTNY